MTFLLILELEITDVVMISYFPCSSRSSSSCGSVGRVRGMFEVEGPTRRCFLDEFVPSVVRSTTLVGFDGEEDCGMVSNSARSRFRRMVEFALDAARDEMADEPGIAAGVNLCFGRGGVSRRRIGFVGLRYTDSMDVYFSDCSMSAVAEDGVI